MYPNIIRKRKLYPKHLGPKWNEAYISNIEKRLKAKEKYKQTGEKKYDSFQETYKLVLNGNFGRLIDRHDWQYDPYTGICVTIGGQVDIFMLAEALEQDGHRVVSMNTDGLTTLVHIDKLDSYYRTCQQWEKQVGNDILGKLEYVEYERLIQLSVNDYIAVKVADWVDKDGKFTRKVIDKPLQDRLKKKGSFLTTYELHKNKSNSIVPKSLEAWFIYNISPEEFIKKHRCIWDFCGAKKASKDYHYRSINRETGEQIKYNKLIRYMCVTKGFGNKIYKIKNEGSEKTGPAQSQIESKSMHQVLLNKKIKVRSWEDWHVDYEHYISAVYDIIGKIQPEVIRDRKLKQSGKLTLF